MSIVQSRDSRDDGMSMRALSAYLAWLVATKSSIAVISACPFQLCPRCRTNSVRSGMPCIGLQNADVVHIANHGEGAIPSLDSIRLRPAPQRFCQSELECRHA